MHIGSERPRCSCFIRRNIPKFDLLPPKNISRTLSGAPLALLVACFFLSPALLEQVKADGIHAAIAPRKYVAFFDREFVRRSMCQMSHLINAALGTRVPRSKLCFRHFAFHENPSAWFAAPRRGTCSMAANAWMDGPGFMVVS
jgi:hypothetical protein